MEILAADVNLVVIVRRDVERRVPDEPILQIGRRSIFAVRPDLHVAHLPAAFVVADDDAADASRAGGGGPDDVRIDRIGRRKAALAASDRVPHAARDVAAAATAAPAALTQAAVARAAVRRPVLLVRVDVVRNLVVDRHVIQLRVWQPLLQPRPPARLRDRDPLVVADDHPVAVGRIDPHVVMIAAGRLVARLRDQRRPCVNGSTVGGVQIVRLVVVVGGDRHSRVIGRPSHRVAIRIDHLPVLTAVVGSPELAALGVLAMPRDAVAGFDQDVYPVRVRVGRRGHHLAHRLGRQTAAGQLRPGGATIAGHEQTAPRTTALASPGVDFDLPHAGEDDARVRRVHRDLRAAGVLVREQRALPRRAAVGRPEHAALGLWTVRRPQRAREDDLGIRRIDHDATDTPGLLEPHARPGLAGVARFVNALTDGNVAANPRLAGSRPHDVRIRRRHRERADRLHRLVVEDLLPVDAAIGRLRNSTGRAAGVVHQRVSRNAGDRGDPVAFRTDVAPAQIPVQVDSRPTGLDLREEADAERQRRGDDDQQLLHKQHLCEHIAGQVLRDDSATRPCLASVSVVRTCI